jgi:uncharacterized protein Yka (UPF0111/DUF47 family)
MSEKLRIIHSLGEPGLLLPSLINAGLAANDRAKYYFTLLQAAAAQAQHPDRVAPDLRRERLACGVEDESCDAIVASSAVQGGDTCRIPGSAAIMSTLLREIETMLQPVVEQGSAELATRFDALRTGAPSAQDDALAVADIHQMTSGHRASGDSLHLLVMDAHKALNALQASIASETIEGAATYGLDPEDRALVRAFMQGVRRTAPLKFDHPGLGTTATRIGDRVVIQNDIGTTDAHVLVVHVERRRVAITYTDVHLQRLLFFQNMFQRFDVEWEDTRSRRDDALEEGLYHLSLGTFSPGDDAGLRDYLAFLGSRLVFLIDWNKARKRLRALVSKSESIRLLAWAADHDVGHMAFLKAGGEQLIYDALDFAAKGQVRFGERLEEILGPEAASQYLKFVLKACSENLLQNEPESFIQDAVRAELFNHFRTGQQFAYDIAAEHAALVVEIAGGVRDGILGMRAADGGAAVRVQAQRAKVWERRADDLVNQARAASKHAGSSETFRGIVEAADDVADELEEAAFHLTLMPSAAGGLPPHPKLQTMGELLVQGAQEYVKLIETARHVRRGGARDDMHDFLEATHRIMTLEHETDEAQRAVEAAMTADVDSFLVLHVLTETARNLEQAADALMHCSLRMRDYVLGEVMTA